MKQIKMATNKPARAFVSIAVLVLMLLPAQGCSSNKSDSWRDYLVALQVHDFELRALRQAEQMPRGMKQDEALAKCKQRYERSLAHLRECSDRLGFPAKAEESKEPQSHNETITTAARSGTRSSTR